MSGGVGHAVPTLRQALDVERMGDLVRRALSEAGEAFDLDELQVLDVRVRPDQPSWVLYRLRGRDGSGRSSRPLLSGQLRPDGEPPPRLPTDLRATFENEGHGGLHTAQYDIPSLSMTLYPYPVDASLPGLAQAASPHAVREAMDAIWRPRGIRVRDIEVQRRGYTPHARAAFEYTVFAEDRRTRVPTLHHLIGKLHAKKPAPRLFADAWAVWRCDGPRIGLAPPVGYLGGIGMTLQARVDGTRLGGLVEAPGFARLARRTARALARLHAVRAPLSTRRKLSEEVRGVDRWAGILASIQPEHRERVQRLRDRLVAEVERRISLEGPTHADFHHTNVLVGGERVTIIDLDEMAFGDPMLDVGRFLASLRVPARRAFGDSSALAAAGADFLDEYLRRSPVGDERRARLYEASSLLIAAGSSYRVQRDGWEQEVDELLRESESLLDASRAGPAHPVNAPDGRVALSDDERAPWLSDPTYLGARIDPWLREQRGLWVEACRVEDAGNHRLRLRLECSDGAERTTLRVDAIPRRHGARRLFEGVRALREALPWPEDALRLPIPVAVLRGIGLMVWEPPRGEALSAHARDSAERFAEVGAMLADIHAAPLDLPRTRSLAEHLRRCGRALGALEATDPELAARARSVLKRAADRMGRAGSVGVVPTLQTVTPDHVVATEHGVGLSRIDELLASHPWIDLADLIARLHDAEQSRGGADPEPRVRGVLEGYRAADSTGPTLDCPTLQAFVAAAMVRLAGRRSPERARGLIERADRALGRQSAPSGLAPLAAGIAPRCRGGALVVSDPELEQALTENGVRVPQEVAQAATVVARIDDLDAASLPEALEDLWPRVRPGGRLLLVAANQDASSRTGRRAGWSRRRLHPFLRRYGRPRVEDEQPFAWLVMSVKRERRRRYPGSRRTRLREARYRATARLCQGRVLELGCGAGDLAGTIASLGMEVTGIDMNADKIERARLEHPDLEFLAADICSVPLPEGAFDTVVLAEVLEHVGEAVGETMLDRAWRCLAPGGRLVVSVPNENLVPHPNHVRQFDRETLEGALRPYGVPRVHSEQPFKWLLASVERARP